MTAELVRPQILFVLQELDRAVITCFMQTATRMSGDDDV